MSEPTQSEPASTSQAADLSNTAPTDTGSTDTGTPAPPPTVPAGEPAPATPNTGPTAAEIAAELFKLQQQYNPAMIGIQPGAQAPPTGPTPQEVADDPAGHTYVMANGNSIASGDGEVTVTTANGSVRSVKDSNPGELHAALVKFAHLLGL